MGPVGAAPGQSYAAYQDRFSGGFYPRPARLQAGNPFARLTVDQQRIIDCFRCVLDRATDTELPTFGGVISQQIDCQGMPPAKPRHLLKTLYNEGLLKRKLLPCLIPGQGGGSRLYWPTAEGAKWLSPQRPESCWDVPLI